MKIAILGATGRIGRALIEAGLARGHSVSAQSRHAGAAFPPTVAVIAADPFDMSAVRQMIERHDAVIYALGFRGRGNVTFFSATTQVLLNAMTATDAKRLIAITGVGAGETRGHGGWLYDRIVFPLFTREIYADKDRQEALIRASDTDWTILRPAPFKSTAGSEPFHALTDVKPGTRLSRVTPSEVAAFTIDCLEQGSHIKEAVFFGHGVRE